MREDILNNVQKTSAPALMTFVIWLMALKMRMEIKNRSYKHTTLIDLGLEMDINILNIKCV